MESSIAEQSKEEEEEEIRSFTGIPEIDLIIFDQLSDDDLVKVCQTNRYARQLCQDERLWYDRILNQTSKGYAKLKPGNMTWKEWYNLWKLATQKHNEINKKLNLSYIDYVIRNYTQLGGILPGSEAYQSLSILLPRAFEDGNPDIVKYFIEAFHQLKDNYFTSVFHPTKLINYPDVISSALKHGYRDFVKELIEVYLQDVAFFNEEEEDNNSIEMLLFLNECGYGIAAALGEYQEEELFKTKILLNAGQIFLDDPEGGLLELKRGYLNGLIASGHNKEAKELFLETKPDDLGLIYPSLASFIIGAKNLEFLDYVNSFIPSDVFDEEYKPIQDRILLEHGLGNIITKLHPVEVFNALLKQGNPLALEYYEENKKYITSPRDIYPSCQLNTKDNKFFQGVLLCNYKDIDYAHCSTDFLVDLYFLAKNSPITMRTTADGITALMIINGRYDAILKVIQDYRTINKSTHWETVLDKSTSTNYKDLYFYFFASYYWSYPTAAQEYATGDIQPNNSFEMVMTLEHVMSSFIDMDISDAEYYGFQDALISPFKGNESEEDEESEDEDQT